MGWISNLRQLTVQMTACSWTLQNELMQKK
jgi:hypothetical protein